MFSNQDLRKMIVPLLLEQLLVLLVGIADTFMISYAGEAAVSGVSLVNSFSTVFIYLFAALASGGAVVVSQYIGAKRPESAGEASGQLLMISSVFSVAVSVLILLAGDGLLLLLFGRVEADVMEACRVYLRVSALSYPALAVYNTGGALYRSQGDTKTTMIISVIANIVNVIGNYIGVFALHAGVAGVAWPTFFARMLSAVAITVLACRKNQALRYEGRYVFRWNGALLKKILRIAVPNGAEGAIFQLVKVALSSIVALFGTYQIAANGVAQSIWSLAAIVGTAMGPVFITVIGQCMGAGDTEQAEYYFKKLLHISLIAAVVWNGLVLAGTPLLLRFYQLSQETRDLIFRLVLIHNIFNATAFTVSNLSSGLRAAGDIRFTMLVSIGATLLVRLVFSWLFALKLGGGVIGIAWAMVLNWIATAVIFALRVKSGKWKTCRVV